MAWKMSRVICHAQKKESLARSGALFVVKPRRGGYGSLFDFTWIIYPNGSLSPETKEVRFGRVGGAALC